MRLNLTIQQVRKLISLLEKEVEPSSNPEDIQYFLDDDGWLLRYLKVAIAVEESMQSDFSDLDDIPF